MKTRILHTRFWQDSYVIKLTHKEKLVFNYLLTNDRVSMTGMYELPDKYIQMDLDLTPKELAQIKDRLQEKVFFYDGWVKILNHDKYNSYKGEKIDIAKEKELANIPEIVKQYQGGIDTSIHTSIDTLNNHKSKTIIINHNIEDITDQELQEIADKYQVPLSFVKSKYDDMILWAGERTNNPKTKGRNWKLTLMSWVKKDSIKIRMDNKRKGGFVDATKV